MTNISSSMPLADTASHLPFPILSASPYHSPSLLSRPGMGLPPELWDAIIDYLSFDPDALLACCLTCRPFQDLAKERLHNLRYEAIFLGNNDDINRLTDEIQHVPTRSRFISNLYLKLGEPIPPVALSRLLLRLAMQLCQPVPSHSVKDIRYIERAPLDMAPFWSRLSYCPNSQPGSRFLSFIRLLYTICDGISIHAISRALRHFMHAVPGSKKSGKG